MEKQCIYYKCEIPDNSRNNFDSLFQTSKKEESTPIRTERGAPVYLENVGRAGITALCSKDYQQEMFLREASLLDMEGFLHCRWRLASSNTQNTLS